ncbi:MAG: GyrI-like domain-containing protein [Smithella sp.]|jgi:AraC family transcriptional regulator
MRESADKLLKNEYRSRLNRTIDYIQNHYDEDLNLTKLAEIACFSKFHFHRIFRAMVGETLNDFVQRIRLEKSVQKLTTDLNKSITEIALDCGFSSSQNFAKIFKSHYGITPSIMRKEFNWDDWIIKMRNLKGKNKDTLQPGEAYVYDYYHNKRQLPIDKILDKRCVLQVKIENLPDLHVAYIRSRGPYNYKTIEPVFRQLSQWAYPRGMNENNSMVLGVVRSNTVITPEDKLIYDVCITVPESIKADRWVGIQVLPGGKFAIHHCEIETDRDEEAWLNLVLNWLASSDYQPDDRPLYQIYYNDPDTHPLKHQILDLCLPIKPLYE